jgi:hypothetical protein
MSGMPDATDNGYVLPRRMEGPLYAPYPGYIQTPDQRERWDVCAEVVSTASSWFEPSGRPDSRFVWVGTRALYSSDTPNSALAELRRQGRRVGTGPPEPTV